MLNSNHTFNIDAYRFSGVIFCTKLNSFTISNPSVAFQLNGNFLPYICVVHDKVYCCCIFPPMCPNTTAVH